MYVDSNKLCKEKNKLSMLLNLLIHKKHDSTSQLKKKLLVEPNLSNPSNQLRCIDKTT
jgi:hypothetical protein